MDCRILRQVTLKADGHLACDDSYGYKIDLGHVADEPGWRLRDVLAGPVYQHVRSAFQQGRVPWPGVCERCDLLSDGAAPQDTLASRVDILVEPTLACALACACCMRKKVLAKGRNTGSLDPVLLQRLVDSCASDGITVGEVSYSGQGEPLLHDDFQKLLRAVRAAAPQANQIVATSGNVDFRSTLGDFPVDRIVVACDGASQGTYGRYRKGGVFANVVRFMRDCRAHGHRDVHLEWKYILFEWNDSDEELACAQQLADDIGVDSLLFIITNSKWFSKRFTVDTITDLKLSSAVARVSPSAAMNAVAAESAALVPDGIDAAKLGHIDVCNVSVGKMLNVEGWVLDDSGRYADHLELLLDGIPVSKVKTTHRRVDVLNVYPAIEGARCGFIFRHPVGDQALPETIEVRVVGASGSMKLGGRTGWRVPLTLSKRRTDLPAFQATQRISIEGLTRRPVSALGLAGAALA